jgi:hypothetical protein
MLTLAVISYISQFSALGNTPAVSLTRSIPHGVDADILPLGCGDVYNVLYTAYTDLGLRKFWSLFESHTVCYPLERHSLSTRPCYKTQRCNRIRH